MFQAWPVRLIFFKRIIIVYLINNKGEYKIKCLDCNVEMKSVKMCGDFYGSGVYLFHKRGIFVSEKRSEVECAVCPSCGKIELKAKTPEVFSEI